MTKNVKIEIDLVDKNDPHILSNQDFWSFVLFVDGEDECMGSADDLKTCADMAIESYQDWLSEETVSAKGDKVDE